MRGQIGQHGEDDAQDLAHHLAHPAQQSQARRRRQPVGQCAGAERGRREQRIATVDWSKRLNVKYASLDNPVQSLSGGNQQKVVLAKWLMTDPKLLIVDEPTRGIDVGTKSEVHRLIGEAVQHGLGVLMISSELPEVLGVADRIYVMREGRVAEELSRATATQETIMLAATGAQS